MAKFTAGVDLNFRLPGGFEAIGQAGTTHRIPDALVAEFERDIAPHIPGFAWVTQDETTSGVTLPIAQTDVTGLTAALAAKYPTTGGTISGAVTATGAISGASLSATGAVSGASVAASGAITGATATVGTVNATTAHIATAGVTTGTVGTLLVGASDVRLRRASAGRMVIDTASATVATEVGLVASSGRRAKLDARVTGDTEARLELYGDATLAGIQLGSGTAAPDTNLYRSAANTLTTDDSMRVVGSLLAGSVGVTAGTSKFIQTGSGSVAMGGTAAATTTVTFPTAFNNAPVVMVTAQYNSSSKIACILQSAPTATQFAVRAFTGDATTSNATAVFQWLAIDPAYLA